MTNYRVSFTRKLRFLFFALVGLVCMVAPSTAAACGGEGQRLCNIFDAGRDFTIVGRGACDSGLTDVGGRCQPCGRIEQRECAVVGRDSCDAGLVAVNNKCFPRGGCGALDQRACLIGERTGRSCDGNLIERAGMCIGTPTCGALGQAACAVVGRNSCDDGLADVVGTCQTPGICGGEAQRLCFLFIDGRGGCNTDLADNGQGICTHPNCGRIGQSACAVFGRNECDLNLILMNGVCNHSACGSFNKPACVFAGRHTCHSHLVEQTGVCTLDPATPPGSYRESCNAVWLDGSTLNGDCRKPNGIIETSYLSDYQACSGDIWNGFGYLHCNKGGQPPQGSYTTSCRDYWVTDGNLHAWCSNMYGGHRYSSLNNFASCSKDINNFEGLLMCGSDNATPRITSSPVATATAMQLYRYQVIATDQDGDALRYSLVSKPSGMQIDSQGLIKWSPTDAQVGLQFAEVTVSDGKPSGTYGQGFNINVAAAPPVVSMCDENLIERDGKCLIPRPLEVSRYTTATLTNADADRILDDATSLLVNNDGFGDLSCLVLLHRRGDVTVFNNGTGFINTQADFNAINNLPGRVKVVNQISFCGTFNNFLGCAPIPGTSQIVVRGFPIEEGVLWAHEYGHTRGLNHVTGTGRLMNGTSSQFNRMVTEAECNEFKK